MRILHTPNIFPLPALMAILASAAPIYASDAPVTQDTLQHDFQATVQPFLRNNCFKCHADGKHKGDFSLDGYSSLGAIQADRRTWATVVDLLSQHAMPPDDRPQPSPADIVTVTQWIGDALTHCDCSGPRDPGRVAIHRLNRAEYNNTIRDLLGVDFEPAKDFPADDTGYGFDNIADVLTMSPLLADKYIGAAEQAVEKAVAHDNPNAPKTRHFDCGGMAATGKNSGGELDTNGECYADVVFAASAEYLFDFRMGQDRFGREPAKMTFKIDDQPIASFRVRAPRAATSIFSYRLHVSAGRHKLATEYINNKVDQNNPNPKLRGDRNLFVDYWEITGPFGVAPAPQPENFKRIFFKLPSLSLSEEHCAAILIRRFATRAFRRAVTQDEVAALMKLYRISRGQGDRFEEAVKFVATAVLVSPHFLYRIELDPPIDPHAPRNSAPAHQISQFELATRMSYFLWSSMPDDELFQLAAAGRLRDPGMIERQVRRMLQDRRSDALVENFCGQWLELRLLDESRPNAKLFPKFNDQLKADMRTEVELYFGSIIRDNHSLLDLIDADYTFLNERLANHYGIPGIRGNEFRRVDLRTSGPDGGQVPHRGGVLEMAGVLTVTAFPNRTSPVRRGKFVLDQLMGTPIPPPPADVPPLVESKNNNIHATMRQRTEQHRADPICASCHMRMDPIGFSMENFDAVGLWRESDGGVTIDPAGKLPDGTNLDGPDGLKRVLLGKREDFVRCVSEKLLTYGLGRGVEFDDACTVRDIVTAAGKDDYNFQTLITSLINSDVFQERRAYEEPEALKKKRLHEPADAKP